jgi:hypothetical protein
LAQVIPWSELDRAFAKHYTQDQGRPSKPIRLMVGLLILKQLDNLSDEQVVLHCKRNPYYQAFCGFTEFSNALPCDSTELVHFRKRIGTEGVDRIFQISVKLHGKAAIEPIIGHLKADFSLSGNFLKGTIGDLANLLMAALAWNLSLWMRAFLAFIVGLLNNGINKLLPVVFPYRPALVAGTFSG